MWVRETTASVRNVSISGMLLETPQELHAGDRVRVDLPLCEGRYPLPIGGTVVRVMTASLKSGVHWFVGCRIDGLDTAGSDGLPRPYRSCLPSM
ncbi:MAG: PilZ domain-containing protein [Chloroflexi bacterium]|nr:PilZ domain-containing protein [Chloroflexota bacterium]